MPEFAAIFSIALLVNVIVTSRASGLWKKYAPKYLPCLVSSAPSTSTGDEESNTNNIDDADPLLGKEGDAESATTKKVGGDGKSHIHAALLRTYLAVYLLAALSDWLQGPYVYALYDAYGYSQHDIAVLFVAGFGSSMVFGSFIGGMADQCGRKKFVMLFSVIYAASCVTKHFKNFSILMLGRLLGGIATSLLFSVFDAWLIRSHSDRGVSNYLSASFSSAQYGNSIVAILAGLVANHAAQATKMTPFFAGQGDEDAVTYVGGYLGPFDIALVALCLCGALAAVLWEENYGDNQSASSGDDDGHHGKSSPKFTDALRNAFVTTMRNPDILSCGIISSLFEGSMYIFVFMWTPALTSLVKAESGSDDVSLPFGTIFSTFMVCCMAGSSLFSICMERFKPEQLAVFVFGVATAAFAVVTMSSNSTVTFLAMNLFEVCVGMYFPSMGTMKGSIVPEDKRAAIYNLYRIPLNFIVLFSLLTDLTPTVSFMLCAAMLSTATILQTQLMRRRLNMSLMSGLKERGMVQMAESKETAAGSDALGDSNA